MATATVEPQSKTQREIPKGQLFINGKWRDSETGKTAPSINPATEEIAAQIAMGTEKDLDDAVQAAQAAQRQWAKSVGLEKTRILTAIADQIEKQKEDLAYCHVIEMGKTIRQARFEVQAMADLFRYHAGWPTKLDGSVKHVPGDFHTYTIYEPVGVVAAITPFNVPMYLAATKIAPALVAGCAFIHKSASATSISALKFADIVQNAGLPNGLYNLVTGPGGSLGKAIPLHPGIDKVALTGSTEVGIDIIRNSAASMKRVTMELGGKSPHIVLADADLALAAQNALIGNFTNSGQICTSGSRLIVERPVYQEVVERLIGLLKACPIGDPLDEKTFFGPVASKDQLEKTLSYIEIGKKDGATLAYGGKPLKVNGKGYFVEPAVFTDANNQMRIAREEIFGPVLTVIPVNDLDEAIAVGNDTTYGLASAVETRDMAKAFRVAREIKAGTVWVNTEYAWNEQAPYGGFKMSGFGRENGRDAYESYLEAKTVWINTNV